MYTNTKSNPRRFAYLGLLMGWPLKSRSPVDLKVRRRFGMCI